MKNLENNWGISSDFLINEAKQLGFEVEIVEKNKSLFYLIKNDKKILCKNIDCGLNSSLAFKISEDKELSYSLLEKHNLAVPKSMYTNKWEDTEINIDFPLVVKPVDGAHGDGVTVDIKNKDRLEKALNYSYSFSNRAIVQNYITWDDHRVLIIGGKFVAATRRVPAFVIGDGENSIEKLIALENTNNDLRGDGHSKPMSYIKIDEELETYIQEQRLGMDSIPLENEQIFVRRNANLSTGGMAQDVTDIIHPQVIKTAIKAANICELQVAGVDILTSNISKSLEETGGVIIEVNATPGLRMHYYPTEWTWRNAALPIVKLIEEKYFS